MPRAKRLPPLRSACYYYRRRSARARSIISGREELEILLETLAVALRRSGARLYAFHIDSTQLHFVLRAGNSPLLPALGVFCHELTRQMNHRRGERGPLFTERARVTVFQPEAWLLPIARYVHSIRPRPNSLPSCNSDSAYRTGRRMTGLTTTAIMRGLSSSHGLSTALDGSYAAFFDAPAAPGEIQLIEHGSPADSRILGDHAFITDVLRTQGTDGSLEPAADGGSEQVIRRVSETVIGRFHALCRRCLSERDAHEWITIARLEQLRSKSRRMPLPLVRGMIADYAIAHGLARCSEVAKYFGLHPKSLAAGLRHRYRWRLLERFSRGSGVARHRIPDIERGAQRVNAELLEDVIAVVFDG